MHLPTPIALLAITTQEETEVIRNQVLHSLEFEPYHRHRVFHQQRGGAFLIRVPEVYVSPLTHVFVDLHLRSQVRLRVSVQTPNCVRAEEVLPAEETT